MGLSVSLAKNLLLSCAAVLVAAGLAEILLRATGYQPTRFEANAQFSASRFGWATLDSTFGWIGKPGTYRSTEEGHVPFTIMSDHSRRTPPPGTDTVSDVLVVGGSFAQGYGVQDHETFAAVLDLSLPAVNFENHGTAGYGAYQSYLVARKQLARRSFDLVIYGSIDHHCLRDVATYEWVHAMRDSSGRRIVAPHVSLENGSLRFHDPGIVGRWPLEGQSALSSLVHRSILKLKYFGQEKYCNEYAALKKNIMLMNDLITNNNSKFIVIILVRQPSSLPFYSELEWKGIVVIDCHPSGWGSDTTLRLGGVGHPSAKLHAHWADCMKPHVVNLLDRGESDRPN